MKKKQIKSDFDKKKLANKLNKVLDKKISLSLIRDSITYIISYLSDSLKNEQSVSIPNFGTFSSKKAKSNLYDMSYLRICFYIAPTFKKILKENRKGNKNV